MKTMNQKGPKRGETKKWLAKAIYAAWPETVNVRGETILDVLTRHPNDSRERVARALKWLVKTERIRAIEEKGKLTRYEI